MNHEELLKLAQTADLTEDTILKITQESRRSALVKMLENGVPEGKELYRFMALTDSMDNTALATKKLESDDANADADRKAALTISALNNQLQGRNPYEVDTPVERDITPSLDTIPVIAPKHEEDAVGVSTLTYDEFVREDPDAK